jgi:hypothetical protein
LHPVFGGGTALIRWLKALKDRKVVNQLHGKRDAANF